MHLCEVKIVKFAAAVSDNPVTDDAVRAIAEELRSEVPQVDLLLLFATVDHRDRLAQSVDQLAADLQPRASIGCTAEGVIGGDIEIERSPGIVALAGHLPGARIHPFHIATDDWRHLLGSPADLTERIGCDKDSRAIIGFGDPWTTALNQLMQALDMLAPRCPLVGGMASGAQRVGENVLVYNDQTFNEGLVGVTLSGPVAVQTVVSQGARPIGRSMVITKAHENVIDQLGGKPALHVLREVITSLPENEQLLLRRGLLIGRAISEYRESFSRGDFLVRNVLGVDQEAGSIAMADQVRVGQTVQFQVRDAASASEDLELMLADAGKIGDPAAALLFSCNGRGSRLFDTPNHDVGRSRQRFPDTPVAGFFAAGEIGPVGGRNFIHGHTASFALLRSPQ